MTLFVSIPSLMTLSATRRRTAPPAQPVNHAATAFSQLLEQLVLPILSPGFSITKALSRWNDVF